MRRPLELRRRTAAALGLAVLLTSTVLSSMAGAAPPVCGITGGHDVCITVPDGPLGGAVNVTISNDPNTATMVLTWLPTGGKAVGLMTRTGRSGVTGDYSFVWPTQKYLDGSGSLRANIGSSGSVSVPVTLSNGNTADFQHSPNDWESYLPGAWTASANPVIGAVGDGADDQPTSNALASSIAAANPALFLYLGDIYEEGTFTENLNVYGASSMDGSPGTLWGSFAHKTQPTLGNHERPRFTAWTDYWHGRPAFDSFTFGGVLFLNLNDTSAGFVTDGPQYDFVQAELAADDTPPPACVVAFWHAPALSGGAIATSKAAMWSLLANNGGDLVLNGHNHFMTEYQPLDAAFQQPGGHMVELISGAGGHKINNPKTDPEGRIAWAPVGKVAGTLYLTLNGAANGGAASRISWSFKKAGGMVLRSGSVTC